MKFFRSKGWLIFNMILWWPIGIIAQFGPDPYTGQPSPPTDIAVGIIMCAALGYWAFHVYRKHYGKLPMIPDA